MGAAPLLMLPVLLMFALQAFDISPRWEADSLALKARTLASGDAVSDEAARFEQLPALPAPPSWDYWQKVGRSYFHEFFCCVGLWTVPVLPGHAPCSFDGRLNCRLHSPEPWAGCRALWHRATG